MLVLPYRDHAYFRLISTRTGETMFEAKMPRDSRIVWGSHYRPREFDALLADDGWSARSATASDRWSHSAARAGLRIRENMPNGT